MARLPIWSRFAARRLAARASAAARQRRYAAAAALYDAALDAHPGVARRHVQAGHMFKEAGDFVRAERHYDMAARLMPHDADLALQRGHFYRLAGRHREAETLYREAAACRPDWTAPRHELDRLASASLGIAHAGDDALLPEYLPRSGGMAPPPDTELLSIRRLGRRDRSPWGVMRTLRGIETIHGHCVTRAAIVELQVRLNGRIVRCEPVETHDLPAADGNGFRKAVFNLWIDFSDHLPGRYHLEIHLIDANGSYGESEGQRSFRSDVAIVPPAGRPALPGSEAWVPPVDPADPRTLDEQIEARPSVVRIMPESLIGPPRAILVLRTDQLGDLVVSVPALKRLRAIAPDARIVGLLTEANADLARTLGVFDEVIVIDFPDLPAERRRVMTRDEQERLRDRLKGYAFDIAIDLAPAEISRALLLLSGATLTMGMGDDASPFLDIGFDLDVRDALGHTSILPSSAKTLAMIEALAAMIRTVDAPIRRADLDRGRLARFGIGPDEPFAVLHAGARIAFSRWPYYPALAARLIAERGLKVVLLGEEAAAPHPDALRDEPRFVAIADRLPFDDLDALLSSCAVFVGNDSGPKHLASLRGTPVVSVHSARTNWGEWGQARGAIVTRQVPCAACHIYHDPEECGRGWTCVTRITVDEVYGAVATMLDRPTKEVSKRNEPR